MTRKSSELLSQSGWRRAGAYAVGLAALLAVASVLTGVLRSTVIYIARVFYNDIPETVEPNVHFLVCVVYWAVFLAAFCAALYFAVLDIRFIRLQYALEKRRLFEQSLGVDRPGSGDPIDDEERSARG